jgi:uncharacterized protein (DUF3820 family)
MKSLEDHVKNFVFQIGKYKDVKLVDITDLEYLDWFVNSDFASKWQKKLVNWYIDDIAKDIQDKMKKEKVEEEFKDDCLQDELKNGMWVDENF